MLIPIPFTVSIPTAPMGPSAPMGFDRRAVNVGLTAVSQFAIPADGEDLERVLNATGKDSAEDVGQSMESDTARCLEAKSFLSSRKTTSAWT